ncbi:hypothetical protein CHS0354_039119, partial [Potamilus streckersoni]
RPWRTSLCHIRQSVYGGLRDLRVTSPLFSVSRTLPPFRRRTRTLNDRKKNMVRGLGQAPKETVQGPKSQPRAKRLPEKAVCGGTNAQRGTWPTPGAVISRKSTKCIADLKPYADAEFITLIQSVHHSRLFRQWTQS